MKTREELERAVEDALVDYDAARAAARASSDMYIAAWKALAAYDKENT